MMTVKITPNDKNNPPGKLADAALHFTGYDSSVDIESIARRLEDTGEDGADVVRDMAKQLNALAGLKLIGFSIWERRTGGGRNVTFPARQYSVNGERRAFALLRPISDVDAQHRVRELILEAYAQHEEQAAIAQ